MGLYLRRRLPRARHRCCPGAALRQHRGDGAAPRGDQPHRPAGAHCALVVDRAGWHTSAKLKRPRNITLIPLPPYAPELNPTENIWEYLRKNNLALRVFDDYDAIVEACCTAWNDLIAIPHRIASITKRNWANVS